MRYVGVALHVYNDGHKLHLKWRGLRRFTKDNYDLIF